MLSVVTLPCLSDNYAYLLHDSESGTTAAIDVPDANPILSELQHRGWHLSEIWLTHHHYDHIDGVADLVRMTGALVTGAEADAHRLPPLDRVLGHGEGFTFAGHEVEVLDVPGHTLGHIAFHVPAAKAAFTGDSLMVMGCGRLFEGTPDQMWASLSTLAKLPEDTNICSGHEYTASNAAFAVTVDPSNAALAARRQDIETSRTQGLPTVPAPLSLELATNPFLRAGQVSVKSALGMENATDLEVFTEIRARKDTF